MPCAIFRKKSKWSNPRNNRRSRDVMVTWMFWIRFVPKKLSLTMSAFHIVVHTSLISTENYKPQYVTCTSPSKTILEWKIQTPWYLWPLRTDSVVGKWFVFCEIFCVSVNWISFWEFQFCFEELIFVFVNWLGLTTFRPLQDHRPIQDYPDTDFHPKRATFRQNFLCIY